MKVTTIAVDLAKSVFEIAVSDRPGRVRERRRLPRSRFLPFFTNRKPALVLLEACGSAHHWGRRLTELGHQVVLLPPHAIRPYVTGNKTDKTDAKGLLEAHRNEQIQPVPLKTKEQQSLTALHRLRSAWIAARTARINTARGLLREFGIAIPLGAKRVVPMVIEILGQDESEIPEAIHPVIGLACEEIRRFEESIAAVEIQLRRLGRQMPVVEKLMTIPGVGWITATALVGFVGDVWRFPTARRFASYLGLTPRERSSGLRRRLGTISKRGDGYLRMLLTHGARSVLWQAKSKKKPDRLRSWAIELEQRRGHNKATIALANKITRIIWAVWRSDVEFEARMPLAA
ncbi:MAG: IS110 family transposase [Acidobacteriota bacterium]|nr:IS110 family transposase [Acidobacteriota bacterium]